MFQDMLVCVCVWCLGELGGVIVSRSELRVGQRYVAPVSNTLSAGLITDSVMTHSLALSIWQPNPAPV